MLNPFETLQKDYSKLKRLNIIVMSILIAVIIILLIVISHLNVTLDKVITQQESQAIELRKAQIVIYHYRDIRSKIVDTINKERGGSPELNDYIADTLMKEAL